MGSALILSSENDQEDEGPQNEKEVLKEFSKSRSKKKRSKMKKLEVALLKVKKKQRKKLNKQECNFPAMELINDPQGSSFLGVFAHSTEGTPRSATGC